MAGREMTDAEVVAHLRAWSPSWSGFGWPTDTCGYEQHCRFVDYRNRYYDGQEFRGFVDEYADKLERGEIPPYAEQAVSQ